MWVMAEWNVSDDARYIVWSIKEKSWVVYKGDLPSHLESNPAVPVIALYPPG